MLILVIKINEAILCKELRAPQIKGDITNNSKSESGAGRRHQEGGIRRNIPCKYEASVQIVVKFLD